MSSGPVAGWERVKMGIGWVGDLRSTAFGGLRKTGCLATKRKKLVRARPLHEPRGPVSTRPANHGAPRMVGCTHPCRWRPVLYRGIQCTCTPYQKQWAGRTLDADEPRIRTRQTVQMSTTTWLSLHFIGRLNFGWRDGALGIPSRKAPRDTP